MGFLGVYKAVYDYVPAGESELAISEGDILYVLEKSGEDDWWKAKKKASGDDDEEPVGLIPNNYIEEVTPKFHARALYDYTRQTDEELSFSEDVQLEVFDTSDPDWILVGYEGEYGFAPANYIEVQEDEEEAAPATPSRPPAMPKRESSQVAEETYDEQPESPSSPVASAQSPAAALAAVLGGRAPPKSNPAPAALALPPRPQYTPEASDDDDDPTPSLPARPQSYSSEPSPGIAASPPHNRATFRGMDEEVAHQNPGGFHMYNINEMVSVMGKKKKMPTTLGINLATGTIMVAPEKARDGPSQEWTAEKMTHYSIEGKHVFLELIRPSKSYDFHAGAKDTAYEIDGALRDLAGAIKAEGLKEVLMAAGGHQQKTGQILYDFMAQGDDEVSVAVDDEVIVLDDTKSEEWWQVRRVKNGKEGVVPSSYIEITGFASASNGPQGLAAGMSSVDKNRLDEERMAKEALRSSRGSDSRAAEVGPGMRLPERGSSLSANGNNGNQQRKRESKQPAEAGQSKSSKAKPDPTKVRTWTDRSKSFSVEAQFLALKDGKINLHKMNGVKIAVPVVKMSIEDLEYVERITGVSLDEDKPLSEIKRQRERSAPSGQGPSGASIEHKPAYDWFPFFLSCDIAVGKCERYVQIFDKGSMDESVQPDIDASVLRNLGILEGDIIKIMRFLDNKFERKGKRNVSFTDGDEGESGGLFSGPGGALRNNTRKGRPAPSVQTNDVISAKAFSQDTDAPSNKFPDTIPGPVAVAPPPVKKDSNGFDDDAWDVKPAKQQQVTSAPATAQPTHPQVQRPALTGAMQELSLLDEPLQPTKAQPAPAPTPVTQQAPPIQPPQQALQPTGATPSFFSTVNQPSAGIQQQTGGIFQQNPQFMQQQTGFQQQPTQQNIARQRPMAPQLGQNQNSLMIPPPPRPLSAPQTAQQSSFGPPPLQPQMTGVPNQAYQSPLAPPGQSLAEMNQMRMQQQYNQQQQQMQSQMTGYPGQMMQQPTGFGQFNSPQPNGFGQMQPQQTGFGQQQFVNGNIQSSPFADSRAQQFSPVLQQPTGFQSSFQPQQQFPQQTGVNTFLPPAMQPQKIAPMQSQPTGINGFGQGFGQQQVPPMPPMPQQQTIQPLVPQQTGPPPPVRFGVTGDSKKLMPQATGRRANLAHATPQNPFGF